MYLANKQIAIACRMQHAYNQKNAGKMKPRKKNEFWDQTYIKQHVSSRRETKKNNKIKSKKPRSSKLTEENEK